MCFNFLDNERGILVEPLIVLKGSINGVKVSVLKDDICSTYVLSNNFVENHGKMLNADECNLTISHGNLRGWFEI